MKATHPNLQVANPDSSIRIAYVPIQLIPEIRAHPKQKVGFNINIWYFGR
jgi:hypothetical protein